MPSTDQSKSVAEQGQEPCQCIQSKHNKPTHLYFIESETGLIKIGVAFNVDERISQLQKASPAKLSLMAFIENGAGLEKQIHNKFEHLRSHGEWFSPTDDLISFIHKKAVLVPQIYGLEEEITRLHNEAISAHLHCLEKAIKIGCLLLDKKATTNHGEFLSWVNKCLPFIPRQAQKYIRLYKHRDELKANSSSHLPINDALKLISGGQPTLPPKPDKSSLETCAVSDLYNLIKAGKKFGTIYCDAPWAYQNKATRSAAADEYETMTLEEIAALPIVELTEDKAHLHLWTTNAFLPESFQIIETWGFDYKGIFVWVKPRIGIGNYWRVSHEFLLLGIKGGLRFYDKSQISWLQAPSKGHSQKPERIAEIIEKVSPGPYLELFGRRTRQNWTVWGNEIERTLFNEEAFK
jgi:N6-adenosine-specific RNA methylase IME4